MRRFLRIVLAAMACALGLTSPALSAGMGSMSTGPLMEPVPAPNAWQFNFTPYAWLIGANGSISARGHTVDFDVSIWDIFDSGDSGVELDSLIALMGYFEARRGRFSFFTDAVWGDIDVSGDYQRSGSPFSRLPNVTVKVKANARVDYEQTIVQSGFTYEIARWPNSGGQGFTSLDLMGSARYWNFDTAISLDVSGAIKADFQRLGLRVNRSASRAVARSGTLEWVDPVVGARLRHQMSSGSELTLVGDVGGFGAGSEFSWQAVATYGFDVNCFGTPLHTVIGYRALAVDFSENGRFGKNALDVVQHGPLMGVSFRW
jgi:hypothetical protein